jgi:hypothetical protein
MVSLTLPGGVTDIGEKSFACCENLAAVTLPASLPFDYMCLPDVFAGCANLAGFKVSQKSPFYTIRDGRASAYPHELRILTTKGTKFH